MYVCIYIYTHTHTHMKPYVSLANKYAIRPVTFACRDEALRSVMSRWLPLSNVILSMAVEQVCHTTRGPQQAASLRSKTLTCRVAA